MHTTPPRALLAALITLILLAALLPPAAQAHTEPPPDLPYKTYLPTIRNGIPSTWWPCAHPEPWPPGYPGTLTTACGPIN